MLECDVCGEPGTLSTGRTSLVQRVASVKFSLPPDSKCAGSRNNYFVEMFIIISVGGKPVEESN